MFGSFSNRRIWPLLVLGISLIFIASLGTYFAIDSLASAGEKPSALSRPRDASDSLPAEALSGAQYAGLEISSSRKVAKNTYIVPRAGGKYCLVAVGGNQVTGTCNSIDNFFGGRDVVFGIREEGRPGPATGLTVVGITTSAVTAVELDFGSSQPVIPVTQDHGFIYTASATDLSAGGLRGISALDQAGRVVDSRSLPAEG